MGKVISLTCHRCAAEYPPARNYFGCPRCAEAGLPSNLITNYDLDEIAGRVDRDVFAKRAPTMWRYKEFLPADEDHIVTLDEGFTPLIECPRLARKLGFGSLYVKDESRNATWSFKDRMASSGVSYALQEGHRVITAASSGNGGAAAAAYAARAGLDSVILTTEQFPLPMRALMQAYGAKVIATPTIGGRWKIVVIGVEKYDWFPIQNFLVPPIGANPFALDGCKTMGYEICEQLGWRLPSWVFAPIGSGDSMVGTWKGMWELLQLGLVEPGSGMPRMGAAEVFGSLADALARNLDHTEAQETRASVAISVAVSNSAYQSLRVLRETNGVAEVASDEEMIAMQLELAAEEGIYTEASSVLALAVAAKLRGRDVIGADESVVVILTSSGLKDPAVTAEALPAIPLIEENEEALARALAGVYGFELS
jgi:threonine synthase